VTTASLSTTVAAALACAALAAAPASAARGTGGAAYRDATPATTATTVGATAPGDPIDPAAPLPAATLAGDGTAIAPAGAPEEVIEAIAAANEIATLPYRYGGGHKRGFTDTAYDCSGSVSFALHGADLIDSPLASTGLMSWGEPGEGRWITVYTNKGHAFMVVAGLRFDTSGQKATGSRWQPMDRSTRGFVVRHPAGL
jgi:cell wall-associated NlpC family hydrolase